MKCLQTALAVLTLTAPLAASVATTAVAAPTMNASDKTFALKFAQSGETELKLAALALQHTKTASVRAYAQKMTKDHTVANEKLTSIGKMQGFMAPSSVGPANEAVEAKLQGLSGSAFDKAYATANIAGHQKALALLQQEVAAGADPQLIAYAKKTMPTVQMHLQMAKTLV